MKRRAGGAHTAADIKRLFSLQRGKCACCIFSLRRGYHVDHIGALLGSIGAATDIYGSEADDSLTRREKDRRAGKAVGGMAGTLGGMFAGAKLGAMAGAFAGPVGAATYRGITGLWGNVWQMVDGLQTNAHGEYRIWDENGHKSYVDTSRIAPSAGFPLTMATEYGADYYLGLVFVPASVSTGSNTGTFGDFFSANLSAVAYHGGHWSIGGYAGLFCLAVENDPAYSGGDVGGRLAKV